MVKAVKGERCSLRLHRATTWRATFGISLLNHAQKKRNILNDHLFFALYSLCYFLQGVVIEW